MFFVDDLARAGTAATDIDLLVRSIVVRDEVKNVFTEFSKMLGIVVTRRRVADHIHALDETVSLHHFVIAETSELEELFYEGRKTFGYDDDSFPDLFIEVGKFHYHLGQPVMIARAPDIENEIVVL